MSRLLPDVSFPLFRHGETPKVSDRFPLRLLSLSGCTIGPEWSSRGGDMTSPFWRLYFNLDDGAQVRTKEQAWPLKAGALYLVPAWLSWQAWCSGAVRHGNALLDLPSVTCERARALVPSPLELALPGDVLAQAWLQFWQDSSAVLVADEALEARGHALVWQALARMLSLLQGPPNSLAFHGDFAFAQLLHWVEQNLDQPLQRQDLARVAHVSEAELARRFQANLGTSPARWIRQRRLTLAAQLLRQTELSVEAVAEKAGLGDRAHFSKVFHAWCGSPPATWRKSQG